MKKLLMLAVLSLSTVALAAPPSAAGEGPRQGFEKKGHLMVALRIAEALELDEADTLKLAERLKAFEARREPLTQHLEAAKKTLKAAAEGDAAAGAQVDQAVQQGLQARAQLEALNQELFTSLSQGQTPQKKARLALALAHFGRGGHGEHGGRHGRGR
jgi:preprotein translocase subunit SecF